MSTIELDGVEADSGLSSANIQVFAKAVARKAMYDNLQPHLGFVIEEFTKVVPKATRERLSWQQLMDLFSGKRLEPCEFIREWRKRTTYKACQETDFVVQTWWEYVSERSKDELHRIFAWCTGFATMPATTWKFAIHVREDSERVPTVNTCMTDDLSAYNHGIRMPTLYLPSTSSKEMLYRHMDWALAAGTAMHLH